MTDNLTQELERLNELDAKRTQGRWLSVGVEQYAGEAWFQIERPTLPTLTCRMTSEFVDATDIDSVFIAAAPDAIALANKLHALLVLAEEALLYVECNYEGAEKAAIVGETLTAIRKAGIGRE